MHTITQKKMKKGHCPRSIFLKHTPDLPRNVSASHDSCKEIHMHSCKRFCEHRSLRFGSGRAGNSLAEMSDKFHSEDLIWISGVKVAVTLAQVFLVSLVCCITLHEMALCIGPAGIGPIPAAAVASRPLHFHLKKQCIRLFYLYNLIIFKIDRHLDTFCFT